MTEVKKGCDWPKMQSCGEVMATHGTSGSRGMATSAHVASTWKARPSAPTASSGLRKRLDTVGSLPSETWGAWRSAKGESGRHWSESTVRRSSTPMSVRARSSAST